LVLAWAIPISPRPYFATMIVFGMRHTSYE